MITPIYIKDKDYILSQTTVQAKITAYQAIISAMEDQMLGIATQSEPVTEFTLSDGQTHIKASYKTFEQMQRGIEGMTFLMNRLINNSKGRTVRAVDIKNFIGRRW